jgi:rhodanese-related sulfurtransferase
VPPAAFTPAPKVTSSVVELIPRAAPDPCEARVLSAATLAASKSERERLKKELDSGAAPILLDVREPYEHAICSLPHSKLIPLRALPGRLRELNPRRDIVAYCHHGRRSVRAMKLLRSKGFKCRNLKGGVEAWADEVDPLMKRY